MQRFPSIPRHAVGVLRDVVALRRRNGDDLHAFAFEPKLVTQPADLLRNLTEPRLVVIDQIHLVHGKHERADAHECADARMTARLREHAFRGVHKDDREIGERGAARHIARVFLMARRIGADEAAAIRREIAVGDVNRDALLALREQTVEQQGVVDGTAAAANLGIEQQRFFLIGVEELRIVEQVPDECGFAVVHAAAGDKFQ